MEFSNNWFEQNALRTWEKIFIQLNPENLLEIGSYEGRSAVFMAQWPSSKNLFCIDTWAGGVEHGCDDMASVESRFDSNMAEIRTDKVEFHKIKKESAIALAELCSRGFSNYFDFIYIDGSHQAPDVLTDAVLAFQLLRTGGVIAFDDYLWGEDLPYGRDPLRCPKLAIDSFVNTFIRKLEVISAPLNQIYLIKREK